MQKPIELDHLNDNIKVYLHDKMLIWTVLWLIPRFIKPNHLTILRYLLSPFILYFIVIANYRIGIPLFLFAAVTDMIDGSLARTRKQITVWGIIHDPIADKILIMSCLAVLVLKHINPIIAFMIIGMEIVFITGGVILKRRGVIQMANWWGKMKMIFQVTGITLILLWLLLNIGVLKNIAEVSLVIAILLSSMGVLKYGTRFGS